MDWISRPEVMPPRPTEAMLDAAEQVLSGQSEPVESLTRDTLAKLWNAMFRAGVQPDMPRPKDMAQIIWRMIRQMPADSELAVSAKDYLDRHSALLQGSPLRSTARPASASGSKLYLVSYRTQQSNGAVLVSSPADATPAQLADGWSKDLATKLGREVTITEHVEVDSTAVLALDLQTDQEPPRITDKLAFTFDDETLEHVEGLARDTGLSGPAEVVQSAIRIYGALAQRLAVGDMFFVQKPDGEMLEVEFDIALPEAAPTAPEKPKLKLVIDNEDSPQAGK